MDCAPWNSHTHKHSTPSRQPGGVKGTHTLLTAPAAELLDEAVVGYDRTAGVQLEALADITSVHEDDEEEDALEDPHCTPDGQVVDGRLAQSTIEVGHVDLVIEVGVARLDVRDDFLLVFTVEDRRGHGELRCRMMRGEDGAPPSNRWLYVVVPAGVKLEKLGAASASSPSMRAEEAKRAQGHRGGPQQRASVQRCNTSPSTN